MDVIGEVVAMGDKENIAKQDAKTNWMLSLEIKDLHNNKLNCALFGEFAEQMSKYKNHESENRIIAIIQFAKIKEFKGEVSLSNSLFSTKVFVNEDIPEINEYMSSIIFNGNISDEDDCQSQRLTHLSSHYSHSISDEFLVKSEKVLLEEICEKTKECFCVALATIVSIEKETNWYKVKVTVEDDSGSATFVMFDREVFQIIQVSAVDIKDKLSKDDKSDSFPKELIEYTFG
ncbi:uncharacterized protein [Spinacia oleracea]|uniref:Replication factor A C-terminal domain-containing protein n=1 Tax=Spinacia oleracea TaxID=3562 RepID=A0ABM3RJB0_SPIOL|nr:uncharacterized protein LOC130470121 [Spinacia oleracea]